MNAAVQAGRGLRVLSPSPCGDVSQVCCFTKPDPMLSHRVMQADPGSMLDDWAALAYDDVDERIWPVAKRSPLAHAERLRALASEAP